METVGGVAGVAASAEIARNATETAPKLLESFILAGLPMFVMKRIPAVLAEF
jgi:hypothetical protein